MRILILGPQGSGKGTQAKRIAAGYGVPHIATGDMFRAAVTEGTELGRKVGPMLEEGLLVPDDLTIDLIRERLGDEDGFVLDGFPRTVPQAEALDSMLDDIGKPLDAVILLQVSDEVATEASQGACGTGRARGRLAGGHCDPPAPVPRAHRARRRPLPGRRYRGHRRRRAGGGRGIRRDPGCARRRRREPMIIRKSPREIEKMAATGALVAETIAHVGGLLRPGVTTDELDAAAGAFIREHGGIPTSEGYKGYPKAICISPNDVVVHGIPDAFVVSEGDLVTIDVGVTLDGYIADSAYTFGVGEIEPEDQRLLDVAQEALAAGIAEAVVDNRVGDVSHAIQEVVEGAGFSVIRSLVGHGVGRHYHEDPHIPNFGEPGRGPRLSEGMTIAIEPMITAGASDVLVMDDGWTIRTQDGSMSAHFEHTVAITADGPRILTPRVGVPGGVEV